MNKFVKDMLMSKYGIDGRNPYGSRGGYVSSRRPRTDRAMNDYADYGYRRDYRDYADYDDYGRNRDYADYNRDYGRDYGRDYAETEYGKLSKDDVKKWKSNIRNADGTTGEHFHQDQCEQMYRQAGINSVDMDTFCMVMNMMYADYCKIAKEYGIDRPDFYAMMSKAFLEDKDFEGTPDEKVWLYYKTIVEKEL